MDQWRYVAYVLIGVAAAVLVAWLIVWGIVEVNENNNERKTERIEACKTVENETSKFICMEEA